ncbi:radical SAM/SPASM family putative metalloenzyme maturase [Desulfovibrio gilichinskyi]|uniref:Putative metalloenzyme radical SAM/SPASM domain maturase n=1 Tax=Desulfovibrio gilichinskyi TaxID=1519643 RepID=A0A1X7CTI2_9BACT|nr:radical SAM/SPASM family putative metalloenzyme maturase [Desulfovibrio gilichinskyi]SMF02929.1 putative metalloenzyme radical SAM/SPASM domain maturase [Desulfovibrio gilichinskyi]
MTTIDFEVAKTTDIKALRPFPSKMQIEVTTRCNMHCSMCVKYAPESDIIEADLDFETFKRLKPAFEHCEGLVLNGIGEPLLHPQLSEMVAYARENMPEKSWIGFQTNGLLLTENLADSLVNAGADTFCISVDSLESENGKSVEIHGQSSVDRLASSFALLKNSGIKYKRELNLGVEFVLMKDSVDQLPNVVRWAAQQGANFMVCSHVLAHGETMQEQSLFNNNTLSATTLFEKWQNRILEMGLDIYNYNNISMKFLKSAADKQLVDMVKKMKLEAQKNNIWINLSSLLEWSKNKYNSTAINLNKICAQAKLQADELGIELRMPDMMARDDLSCHFMEDGAAFVTSKGDVSPCQFLWHGYSCRMDGSAKLVKPWVFGNLAEDDFAEIWRSAKYSEFRSEVLDYAYPYCSNCPIVPCDDITGKSYDFETDCLGAQVPCGHCPWAMGGLQCLL